MKRLILRANAKKKKYFLNNNRQESNSSLESLSDDDEENIDNIIGKILNDRYLILRYIDKGTFCKFYLVMDIHDNEFFRGDILLKVRSIVTNPFSCFA